MGRFADHLRRIRNEVSEDTAARKREEQAERIRERDRDSNVDAAADALEDHIENCLHEFTEEFVEFRFDRHLDEGRFLHVTFNEPASATGPKSDQLHRLSFRVRRHHKYADVELEAKMIVGNSERTRRRSEEDVFDGDPQKLHTLAEELILKFSKHYLENRGW